MKQRQAISFLIIVLALALGTAWYFGQNDRVYSNAADLTDGGNTRDEPAPLDMPMVLEPTKLEPADGPDTKLPKPVATAKQEPVLGAPDYGPAIQRGGAVVEFELYDSSGNRVATRDYSVKLWRRVGRYWIADEADTDDARDVVVCDGYAEQGSPGAGLEPGSFELELFSRNWGNFRHEFSVNKGERRTDRLTTPNTKAAVAFKFTDADGNPIAWLPNRPRVSTTSDDLEGRDRQPPDTVQLRRPPTRGLKLGGGVAWRSSRSRDGVASTPDVPPLYPTDDGRWWVHVYSGGYNTVTFKLDDLWGGGEYTIADRFISQSEVSVVLPVAGDFSEQVREWGKPVEGYTPGQRDILQTPASEPRPAPLDPYTADVRAGYTRLIVEAAAPVPVKVQLSLDGKKYWRALETQGGAHWLDLSASKKYWMRIVDGRLLVTEWEPVELNGGGIRVITRDVSGPLVTFSLDRLTPTLQAFAHSIDLDIAIMDAPKPEPVEDPKVVEDAVDDDPSDIPNPALAENRKKDLSAGSPRPDPRPVDTRFEKPSSTVIKLVMRQRDLTTLADSEQIRGADITPGVSVRSHLRGVSRFRKGRNGGASSLSNQRYWFEPLVLGGRWESIETGDRSLAELLAGGHLQPRFDNVFTARAVGPQQEGLPWVKGVIVDYEADAIAQQVREICREQDNQLTVSGPAFSEYAEALMLTEADPNEQALRALIGDTSFDALQTDEQRLWFARHGAWYDTSRKVECDEQGYFAIQDPPLEPGRCYVLYLWSNSRDDLTPDVRFAFRVDERGIADLGAIQVPTYTD